MNTERASSKKSKGWIYAIIGLLALIIIGLSCWLISLKSNLNVLESEKEQQRADFQAEVDSLLRVHNELKENYGELSSQLAENAARMKSSFFVWKVPVYLSGSFWSSKPPTLPDKVAENLMGVSARTPWEKRLL